MFKMLKFLLIFVFALGLAGLSTQAAMASDIVVNTNQDVISNNGLCSLREAVDNANNNSQIGSTDCVAGNGTDTILFAPGVSGQTIALSSTLSISSPLSINGASVKVTISGNNAVRVFNVTGSPVTIKHVTIANGYSLLNNETSAGIMATGASLTIDSVTFSNNQLLGNNALGGAIYFSGTSLTIVNSTFINNTNTGNPQNVGGALYVNSAGTVNIAFSTFKNNQASGSGGAIYQNAGTVTLNNSIITGSTGGGCNTTVSGSNNLLDTTTCGAAIRLGTTGVTNLAATLADNVGSTPTLALSSGSNAIDRVSCGTTTYDQRGIPRPLGTSCDIGAFEYEDTAKVNSNFAGAIVSKTFTATPDTNYPAYSAYGITTLNTQFTNTSSSTVTSVYFKVNTITSDKYVLDANGGPGQVGGVKFLALSMAPNAGAPATFRIGHSLVKGNFAFLVDVWGKVAVAAADDNQTDIYLGTIAFNVSDNTTSAPTETKHRVFLPLTIR